MTTLSTVIAEGAFSARPAAGIPGRLYFATDTGKIYRDNGTGWDDVTPSSTGGSGINPVTLPAANGGATYTLPVTLAAPANSMYFVRGIKRVYGSFYSISGTTLTILTTAEAPQTGDAHELYGS